MAIADSPASPVDSLDGAAAILALPLPRTLALAGLLYAWCFVANSVLAWHAGGPAYWTGWFDQSQYWRSALALRNGDLAPAQHWYPLLYPLLLAPFTALGPLLAALVTGLCLYVAAFCGFARLARHFGVAPLPAMLIFVASTLLPWTIGKVWFEPWTTTASAALILWALAFAADLTSAPDRQSPASHWAAFGALLALTVCTRPGDAVVAVLLGAGVGGMALIRRKYAAELVPMIVGGAVAALPFAALYWLVWGLQPSPYARLAAAFGFNFAWLGWKAYLLLIEPRPWFPEGAGLLREVPWLVIGLAGVASTLALPGRRLLTLLVVLPSAAYLLITLAYIDLLPSGLWQFNNVHYFKWLLPLLTLFAARFVLDLRRARGTCLIALAASLLATSWHYVPLPAAPGQPARLLVFAAPGMPYATAYNARTRLLDAAGEQFHIADFHQVPDRHDHLYVAALRRDFVGEARIVAAGPAAGWPYASPVAADDGTAVARATGPLVGRFAPHLALGWPCWLPGLTCAFTRLPLDRGSAAR